jgi:glycolate oxidase iron-sulfur subunit
MADATTPLDLKDATDRCVKCGLCLPDCPTYRLTGTENESPRGRIALIEGRADGRLAVDDALLRHLDHCLLCRRCERSCPSGVAYGAILDAARSSLLPPRRPTWYQGLTESPVRLRALSLLARLVPPWVTRAVPPAHRLHRLARALHAESPPAPREYPARGRSRGRIGLFAGCATYAQQGGALQAAVELLCHSGFEVVVPREAGCCGALAAHAGQTDRAAELAARNREAFDGCDGIVSIASGCGTHLDTYTPPLPGGQRDVCDFLLTEGRLGTKDFQPRDQKVLVHTPCSMANVYRGEAWAYELLGLIPGLRVEPVGEAGQCCGSAGDYLLRHPKTAQRLRQPLVDDIVASDADAVVTTNVGCAMHLGAGLAPGRHAIEVLHPVELLARQLVIDGPSSYAYAQELATGQ